MAENVPPIFINYHYFYECWSHFDDLRQVEYYGNKPTSGVSLLSSWYEGKDDQVIHINDLDRILKNEVSTHGMSKKEATRLLKSYYERLPEYREENLREAYQYYIEQWNK